MHRGSILSGLKQLEDGGVTPARAVDGPIPLDF